jgi:ADP-ribose pyrophosphatase YjhB (NUDIX family)
MAHAALPFRLCCLRRASFVYNYNNCFVIGLGNLQSLSVVVHQWRFGVKYCMECGERLEIRWDEQDLRDRLVCRSCNLIRYENPRILVATMLTYQDRLLLCRRAEEPSLGKWNPPSGFMERGETLEQAAARETFEEVGVKVSPSELDLYTVTSLAKISEVYVCFRGSLTTDAFKAGREVLDVQFFSEDEIPWKDLAYPEMSGFLKLFFRESATKAFGIHLSSVDAAGRSRSGYRLAPKA